MSGRLGEPSCFKPGVVRLVETIADAFVRAEIPDVKTEGLQKGR